MSEGVGKKFETDFRNSFKPFSQISVDRIYDNMGGFKGVQGIGDFIVYAYPYQYVFELKSTKLKSLPISMISEFQIKSLTEKSKVKGIFAGILINYRDDENPKENLTYYLPIQNLNHFMNTEKRQSIPKDYNKMCPVRGVCKISRWVYDVLDLLNIIPNIKVEE